MARVFVTGSADGLGLLAAQQLLAAGHTVTLHARSAERAADAAAAAPGAEGVLVGDLSSIAATTALAAEANASGRFDAVIHNAGVGYHRPQRTVTDDGLELHFAVNVLAPYLLTALMTRADRLVYLSSGMHRGGHPDLDDLQWQRRRWQSSQAYSDSKLFDVVLAFTVARRWPDVAANAVEPGWVATKMGGPSAPDDLDAGADTQAWLAAGEGDAAGITGAHLYHRRPSPSHPAASDVALQDALLAHCGETSGVPFPTGSPGSGRTGDGPA